MNIEELKLIIELMNNIGESTSYAFILYCLKDSLNITLFMGSIILIIKIVFNHITLLDESRKNIFRLGKSMKDERGYSYANHSASEIVSKAIDLINKNKGE